MQLQPSVGTRMRCSCKQVYDVNKNRVVQLPTNTTILCEHQECLIGLDLATHGHLQWRNSTENQRFGVLISDNYNNNNNDKIICKIK